MKKIVLFPFAAIMIGASILAACGAAPTARVPAAAPLAPLAPPATTIPQSTNPNSAPVVTNNCTLLSKDEVGTVLTEAVTDVRDPAKGTLCVYQTKSLILELGFLTKFGGYGDSVQYMQALRTDNIGDAVVDVKGLGEEAFYHGFADYRILFVRLGATVYTFGVRNVTADQSISSPSNAQILERSIAGLLVGRLP